MSLESQRILESEAVDTSLVQPSLMAVNEINAADDEIKNKSYQKRPKFRILLAALVLFACSPRDIVPQAHKMPMETAMAYNPPNESNTIISPDVQGTYDAMDVFPQDQEVSAESDQQNEPEFRQKYSVEPGDNITSIWEKNGISLDEARNLITIIMTNGVARLACDFDWCMANSPDIYPEMDELLVVSNFDNAEFQLAPEFIHITP